MKKRLILSVAAALVAFGAGAQSKTVERFANRWDGAEGVSVVSLRANVVKMDEVGGVDVSNFIKSISSITIVANEKPNEEFARGMQQIVEEGDYTLLMSVSQDGERVKILYGGLPGTDKGQNELIITVSAPDKITLISAVGKVNINQ